MKKFLALVLLQITILSTVSQITVALPIVGSGEKHTKYSFDGNSYVELLEKLKEFGKNKSNGSPVHQILQNLLRYVTADSRLDQATSYKQIFFQRMHITQEELQRTIDDFGCGFFGRHERAQNWLETKVNIPGIIEPVAKDKKEKGPARPESSTGAASGGAAVAADTALPEDLQAFIERSNAFYTTAGIIPSTNNLVQNIINNVEDQNTKNPVRVNQIPDTREEKIAQITQDITNTYPIAHTAVQQLIKDFLAYKRTHGSENEKALYTGMTTEDFITRLLHKRPLAFYLDSDKYKLRDGKTTGNMGNFDFTKLPTSMTKPYTLQNYISYDEMPISALLGVSVPTYFINNGKRDNKSRYDARDTFEPHGIYVGLVGARFERPELMEYKYMLVTPEQNTAANGYGPAGDAANKAALTPWAKFYGIPYFPTYEEVTAVATGKFTKIGNAYLNNDIFKKRMRFVLEPFLIDANQRAQKAGKKAYAHVVGLGTGVWAVNGEAQEQMIMDVTAEILNTGDFANISDVNFSWFNQNLIKPTMKKPITLHYPSKRNPADPLTGADEGKLLVAMYAWDGNSYPGNEYWFGSSYLAASGDPAAASCSTIPQLQNPQINTDQLQGSKAHLLGTSLIGTAA